MSIYRKLAGLPLDTCRRRIHKLFIEAVRTIDKSAVELAIIEYTIAPEVIDRGFRIALVRSYYDIVVSIHKYYGVARARILQLNSRTRVRELETRYDNSVYASRAISDGRLDIVVILLPLTKFKSDFTHTLLFKRYIDVTDDRVELKRLFDSTGIPFDVLSDTISYAIEVKNSAAVLLLFAMVTWIPSRLYAEIFLTLDRFFVRKCLHVIVHLKQFVERPLIHEILLDKNSQIHDIFLEFTRQYHDVLFNNSIHYRHYEAFKRLLPLVQPNYSHVKLALEYCRYSAYDIFKILVDIVPIDDKNALCNSLIEHSGDLLLNHILDKFKVKITTEMMKGIFHNYIRINQQHLCLFTDTMDISAIAYKSYYRIYGATSTFIHLINTGQLVGDTAEKYAAAIHLMIHEAVEILMTQYDPLVYCKCTKNPSSTKICRLLYSDARAILPFDRNASEYHRKHQRYVLIEIALALPHLPVLIVDIIFEHLHDWIPPENLLTMFERWEKIKIPHIASLT